MSIETRVPPLKDRLENALNEGRILMLGVQVLIGFDYRSVFEETFPRLPKSMQYLKLASLGALVFSLAVLFAPLTFHWIAGRGRNFQQLHDFAQQTIEWVLFPFAFAMAVDVMVSSVHIVPVTVSLVLGAAVFLLGLLFWYGLGYFKRGRIDMPQTKNEEDLQLELKDRIKEVLIETRLALPGVQATLGFQFIIVLATGFASLPQSLRYVHLASLLLSAVCAVLLIAPAAYHRIALRGQDSEQFLHFASVMLLTALLPLALAITGDIVVVAWKITQSMTFAFSMAGACLVVTLGFWYGYMYVRRLRSDNVKLKLASHRVNARLDHLERS